MEVEGQLSIETAVTKKGKNFLKITVGDKFLYDFKGITPMDLEGQYVKATYIDGQFPKVEDVVSAKPQKQTEITNHSKKPVSENVPSSYGGNPANHPTYLQLKLAVEMVIGTTELREKSEDHLQYLENCYKKIKSLWKD